MLMTPRERVESAFRLEQIRPTPYTVWYDHETRERLTRHYGSDEWRERIEDHVLRVTVDWEPRTFIDDKTFLDVHGSKWELGDPVHLIGPVLKEPDLSGYSIPSYVPYLQQSESSDPTSPHTILPMLSYADARDHLGQARNRMFTVAGYGNGFFESAWMMRGYENFFTDLLLAPTFAHELLDRVLERHLELVDEMVKLPCDGIIFSDDYGDQRGVIIGPDHWRAFVKPRLAKLYARVHAAGKMTFQHTCGSVFDIIPDLIEIGLDVLQSLQPEAMPVYEIKRLYGDRLRLWGGLGTQQLLPFGTPKAIRAEVQRLKRELGRAGGYVFTSSKPVMKEVPLENAIAFIEETVASDA